MQCAFQLTTAVHMIIIALCAVHYAICAQIIISPNCTQEDVECYGLSQLYADDPENLKLSSDTTIVFQNGVHSMMSDIVIRGIDNLMLQFEENSQIHCVERAELVFMNVTNLLIFGLKLTNCGAEISESLVKEALSVQTETVLKFEKGLQAAIFAVNIQQFQMDEAVINGSYGYGFLGINIIGDSSVANTLINSSNTNSLTDYCMNPRLTPAQGAKCLGGNALFVFNDYPDCPATINYYTLTVANSTFSHGLDPTGGFHEYISRGAGLGIIVSQKYYDVHVKLINSTFTANTAKVFGSNIYIILMIIATNSSVSIHSSQLMYGNSDNSDGPYSALVFFHGHFENSLGNSKNCSNLQQLVTNCAYHCHLEQELRRQILLIEDSEFYSNAGGALYLVSLTSLLDVRITYTVLIRNCTISKNYAIKGSAMFVSDISSENTRLLEMTVENTLFEDHTTLVETYLGTHSNINLIISVKRFTIKNCTFMNNNKSALMSYDSNIHFEGETIFKNNTARYGGAIHFTGNSVMYLRPNAQIIFDGNSALQRGGAIYLTGGTEVAYFSNCQIQVFDQRLLDRIELVEHLPHAPHDGPALDLAGRRVQRDQCAVEDGQIEFGAGILICASQARKVTGSLDGCKRNYRILFADTRFRENQVARMSERPLAAEVLHRPGEHRPNAGLDDVPHLLRVEERDVHGLRISRQRYSQHLPRTVLHLHDGGRRHPRDDGDVLTLGRLLLGKLLACRRVPVWVVTQQVLDGADLECLVERVRGLLSQQPIEWVGERRHQFLQHSVAVSTCVRISAVTDRPGSITPRPTGTGHPADHPDRRARRRPGGARRRAPRAARPGRPARLRP